MRPFTCHEIVLEACDQCGGIWLDGGELERLEEVKGQALVEAEQMATPQAAYRLPAAHDRWCPVCSEPMSTTRYGDTDPVELDSCGGCGGVWADDGELARLQVWLINTRVHKRMPTEAESRAAVETALAQALMEHERFMDRAHVLTAFLKMLQSRRGGHW